MTDKPKGPAALAGEIPALTAENANVQRYVSLVRVGNEWHAFSDVRRAWRFYETWKQFRDCEYVGDVPIDVDTVD